MPGTTVAQRSVYFRALANGITEVLAVYRSAVLQVEQSLMSDPVPVLAAVTQGLYQVNYQSTSSQMPYLFVITQI